MPAQQRRALHAYLSEDAHERWHEFSAEHGVSLSAFLEALSGSLEPTEGRGELSTADIFALANEQARRVDAERRRRSPAGTRR